MPDTTHLALPEIEASQSQKHVTHNEALKILDAVVQLSVLDRDLTAPPGGESEGDRYIVATGATGAWAGMDAKVAAFLDGAWSFFTPAEGWIAWVADEDTLLTFTGSAWSDFGGALGAIQNLSLLGVGTTADATNPFSAKLNSLLLTAKTAGEGGDGDLRFKANKETAGDTVSYLFQTNFSGRAEFGLIGDDDWSLKVSPDGSSWKEAVRVDKDTGAAAFTQHPKFSGWCNYDQYNAAGAWFTVDINNLRHNDQGAVASGVFTAPHDGYYAFGGGYRFKLNSTAPTIILIGFSINSATPLGDHTSALSGAIATDDAVSVTAMLKLAAGATVELQAFFTTNDGYIQADANHFWGHQVA